MFERRSDRDLKQRVLRELKWDSRISWASISVDVDEAVVTLSGTVPNYVQKLAAQEAAHRVAIRRMAGVVGVINKITIRKQTVNEKQLREEIEFALERRADREAQRLRVEIHDGTVDLWGRVHSWQEKGAIIGSIAHAPGVHQLRDHLRIDPYF